jgi:hypothetical protein
MPLNPYFLYLIHNISNSNNKENNPYLKKFLDLRIDFFKYVLYSFILKVFIFLLPVVIEAILLSYSLKYPISMLDFNFNMF